MYKTAIDTPVDGDVVRVRAICTIDRSRCAIDRLIALAMGFLVRVRFRVRVTV